MAVINPTAQMNPMSAMMGLMLLSNNISFSKISGMRIF
jgi:hypothetical protein